MFRVPKSLGGGGSSFLGRGDWEIFRGKDVLGWVFKDDRKSHPEKWEGEKRRCKCVKQKNAVSVGWWGTPCWLITSTDSMQVKRTENYTYWMPGLLLRAEPASQCRNGGPSLRIQLLQGPWLSLLIHCLSTCCGKRYFDKAFRGPMESEPSPEILKPQMATK